MALDLDAPGPFAHLAAHSGKMLRGVLLLASAGEERAATPDIIDLAVAVELLHLGTLCHDDVLDNSGSRRGAGSVNAVWGNRPAVFSGAVLFSRAMRIFAGAQEAVLDLAVTATRRAWKGQMEELEGVEDFQRDTRSYWRVVRGKTATLFELPCQIGAELGVRTRAQASGLVGFAKWLGMAYQVADDLCDYAGDEDRLGKQRGTDAREGVYTLPLLLAIRKSNGASAGVLGASHRGASDQFRLEGISRLIRESGALDTTRVVVEKCLARSRDSLGVLPDDDVRQSLLNLIDLVGSRTRDAHL